MALVEAVKNIFREENNMVELDAPVSEKSAKTRHENGREYRAWSYTRPTHIPAS